MESALALCFQPRLSSLTSIPINHTLIDHDANAHAHIHIHIQFATEMMLYELFLTDSRMIVLKVTR
jgi:hypothetical protein